MSDTGFQNGSVFDYLSLPTRVTGLTGISALYNRAIDLIWNEWFRDENLQNSLTIQKGMDLMILALMLLEKETNVKTVLRLYYLLLKKVQHLLYH